MHRLIGPGVRLAGITALIALVIGLLGAQASAADETVSIGSATIVLEGSAGVAVNAANFHAPGLGAWSIDVTYDPSVLSVVACEAAEVGANICNADYLDLGTTVRIVGASAQGLEGDTTLATITFRCDNLGTSPLSVAVGTLADATPGMPVAIEPVISGGSVACVSLHATSTPGPDPTARPTDEPDPTATTVVVAQTCDDFSFQEDAQAAYDGDPAGHSQLDADSDGLACELLPSRSAVAGTTQGAGLPGAGTGGGAPFSGMTLQGWLMAGLAGAGIAWLAAGLAGAGVSTLNAASARRAGAGTVRFVEPTPPVVHETRIEKQPASAKRERPAPAADWLTRARDQLQDIDVTRMGDFGWWRLRGRRRGR